MFFRKFVSAIITASFLYSNCVYAIPQNTNNHTLASQSAFKDLQFTESIEQLENRLDTNLLPPEEVIRIVNTRLAQLSELKNLDRSPALMSYIDKLIKLRERAERRLKSPTPKAVIECLRKTFVEAGKKEYSYVGKKTEEYENKIAPFVEEYGLFFGKLFRRADWNVIKKALYRHGIIKGSLFILGFRTLPILTNIIIILAAVSPFAAFVSTSISLIIFAVPFILFHDSIEGKIGATGVTTIIWLSFIFSHFAPFYLAIPITIFSPYVIHSGWNRLMDFLDLQEYKATCWIRKEREEARRRAMEELRKRNENPSAKEVADAESDAEKNVEDLNDAISDAESAIKEEIQDAIGKTDYDGDVSHTVQETMFDTMDDFFTNGETDFDKWFSVYQDKMISQVFPGQNAQAIKAKLASAKVREQLRKTFELKRDKFSHKPDPDGPKGSGGGGKLAKILKGTHTHADGTVHRDHHGHTHGTTLKMIAFLVLSIGAAIYGIITNNPSIIMAASILGFGAVVGGGGEEEGEGDNQGAGKPELIDKYTINMSDYIKTREKRDYYYSGTAASRIEGVITESMGSARKRETVQKTNALIIAQNTDVAESFVDTLIDRIIKKKGMERYPNLLKSEFLMLDPTTLVEALAIPGAIDKLIRALAKEMETTYKDKHVVLVLNFKDLYDLGEMTQGQGSSKKEEDIIKDLYNRLSPLLNSKTITVLGIISGFLAGKLSSVEIMADHFEEINLPDTDDFQIEEAIDDEIKRLKDILPKIEISIHDAEKGKLIHRLKPLCKSRDPSLIIRDKLEEWLKQTFLKTAEYENAKEREIEQLTRLITQYKETAVRSDMFNKHVTKWIARHIKRIKGLEEKIKAQREFMEKYPNGSVYNLTANELIPPADEWEKKVPEMRTALTAQVIDQPHAIDAIVREFETKVDIGKEGKPIGAFLFLGPTGVGKTETARALARFLFGDEEEIVREDGSALPDKEDVWTLTGPPPSYAGYYEGGRLTNAIEAKGFCVVLLDEIEKADRELQTVLLGYIDGGRLENNRGKVVDCTKTVLIMTSNLGYRTGSEKERADFAKIIKDSLRENIKGLEDDKVKEYLKLLRSELSTFDEELHIFEEEVKELDKLLQGAEVSVEGNVLSFAAAREAKAAGKGRQERKEQMRVYLQRYIGSIIDNLLALSVEDISTVQELYARLNYYEDTQPLTNTDSSKLQELLSEITKKFKNYYKLKILGAFLNKEEIKEEWKTKLQEIQDNEAKDINEQKRFFLSKMRGMIEEYLKKNLTEYFSYEFLGKLGAGSGESEEKISNVIIFDPLTKGALRKILKLKLAVINKALAKDDMGPLVLAPEVEELLFSKGFSPELGARPLIRAMLTVLLQPLADAKLNGNIQPKKEIKAELKDGKVEFSMTEGINTKVDENAESAQRLIEAINKNAALDIKSAFGILGLEYNPPAKPEEPAPSVPQEKTSPSKLEERSRINFSIQIPLVEVKPFSEIENLLTEGKLDERIENIENGIRNARNKINEYQLQMQATSNEKQRTLIQEKIDVTAKAIRKGEKEIEILRDVKNGKKEDARKKYQKLIEEQGEELSKREEMINNIFINITQRAAEDMIFEKPTDPEAIYSLTETVKGRHRNDVFLSTTTQEQLEIVEETARGIADGKYKGLEKTRFLKIRFEELSTTFYMGAEFEASIRELLNIIHEDDKRKGIRTVIVMELQKIKEEITRLRYNPIVLSFFLKICHKYPDITYIMAGNNSSILSKEVFERYFREVKIEQFDYDELLKAITLCTEDWLSSEKTDEDNLKGAISFELKQRAVKIWEQFYSGTPPLKTIKGWFIEAVKQRKAKRDTLLEERNGLLENISRRLNRGNGERSVETLRKDSTLVKFIEKLNTVEKNIQESMYLTGGITKEELDAVIMEREKKINKMLEDKKSESMVDLSMMDMPFEKRALALEDSLKSVIKGQDESINRVAASVKINAAGLNPKKGPIGSFFFGGPTAVGKTETAKQTAKIMGMRFIRIDMGGYTTEKDVRKLIGSPKGYVGSEGEGFLFDLMRENPRSVILFDEVEKAHPDVFNVLLQILDDGALTSNRGNKIDFSQSMIFMTSNLGVQEKERLPDGTTTGRVVYDIYPEMAEVYKKGDKGEIEAFDKKLEESVRNSIPRFFRRPELLNRIDAIEVFLPLKKEVTVSIAEKFVRNHIAAIENKYGIKIVCEEDDFKKCAEKINEKGFAPEAGARVMARLAELWTRKAVSAVKSELDEVQIGTIVRLKWEDEKIVLNIEKPAENNAISESAAGKIELLAELIEKKKGDQIETDDLLEVLYPEEAKPKSTGAKGPFSSDDISKGTVITDMHPLMKDEKTDAARTELIRLIKEARPESEVFGEADSPIDIWINYTIKLCKRLNLWRHEGDKKKIPDRNFWNYGKEDRVKITEKMTGFLQSSTLLRAELSQDGTLGDKKVVVLTKKEGDSYSIGIMANSNLGRIMERILLEKEYTDEAEILDAFRDNKFLQEYLKAVLALKKAGIEVKFDLGDDNTIFWLKIPLKSPAPAAAPAAPATAGMQRTGTRPAELEERRLAELRKLFAMWLEAIKQDGREPTEEERRDFEEKAAFLEEQSKAGLATPARPEIDTDTLKEIKDIADRLANTLDEILINRYGIQGQTLTTPRILLGSIRDLRKACTDNNIPYEIIKNFIFEQLEFRDAGDQLMKFSTQEEISNWEEKIKKLTDFLRAINGLDNLPKLPEEFLGAKDALYRLLTLEEDGTPIERKRITSNVDDIFYSGPAKDDEIRIKTPDEKDLLLAISPMNWDTKYLCVLYARNLQDPAYTLYIGTQSDKITLELNIGEQRNSVLSILKKDGPMVVNIGYLKTGEHQKYVFVVKDSVFDVLKANPDFAKFRGSESPNLSWEVISETECNYRLTIDPEFEKLFIWSNSNVSGKNSPKCINVMPKIRDIAGRINNILEKVWKEITDENMGTLEVRDCSIQINSVQKICAEQGIPYDIIENFLIMNFGFQKRINATPAQDVLFLAKTDLDKFYKLSKVIALTSTIASINRYVSSLDEVPGIDILLKDIMNLKTEIYRMLTLNPDGTPMDNKKIAKRPQDIFTEFARKQRVKVEESLNISTQWKDGKEYDCAVIGNRNNSGFWISARKDGAQLTVSKLRGGDWVNWEWDSGKYDVLKNGNPLLNIGESPEKRKYILVVDDSFYQALLKDPDFLDGIRHNSTEGSWEVISESECNYRLMIGEEGFAEMFTNWDTENIETVSSGQKPQTETPSALADAETLKEIRSLSKRLADVFSKIRVTGNFTDSAGTRARVWLDSIRNACLENKISYRVIKETLIYMCGLGEGPARFTDGDSVDSDALWIFGRGIEGSMNNLFRSISGLFEQLRVIEDPSELSLIDSSGFSDAAKDEFFRLLRLDPSGRPIRKINAGRNIEEALESLPKGRLKIGDKLDISKEEITLKAEGTIYRLNIKGNDNPVINIGFSPDFKTFVFVVKDSFFDEEIKESNFLKCRYVKEPDLEWEIIRESEYNFCLAIDPEFGELFNSQTEVPLGNNTSTTDAVQDTKDTARQLAKVFEYCFNNIKVKDGFAGANVQLDEKGLREYLLQENIPYEVVKDFLLKFFFQRIENGYFDYYTSGTTVYSELRGNKKILKKIKKFLLSITSISDLSEILPLQKEIQQFREALYALLKLDPDSGKAVDRKNIRANVNKLFEKIPQNKLKRADILEITPERIVLEADGAKYALSVSETRGPVINVGISQDYKKYVFVIKQSAYAGIKADINFIKYYRGQNSKFSWEVISESECNYRLTIGEEGFAEMFNRDPANVVTTSAGDEKAGTATTIPAPAPAPALTDAEIESAKLLTDELFQALWALLTTQDAEKINPALDVLEKLLRPAPKRTPEKLDPGTENKIRALQERKETLNRRNTQTFSTMSARPKDKEEILEEQRPILGDLRSPWQGSEAGENTFVKALGNKILISVFRDDKGGTGINWIIQSGRTKREFIILKILWDDTTLVYYRGGNTSLPNMLDVNPIIGFDYNNSSNTLTIIVRDEIKEAMTTNRFNEWEGKTADNSVNYRIIAYTQAIQEIDEEIKKSETAPASPEDLGLRKLINDYLTEKDAGRKEKAKELWNRLTTRAKALEFTPFEIADQEEQRKKLKKGDLIYYPAYPPRPEMLLIINEILDSGEILCSSLFISSDDEIVFESASLDEVIGLRFAFPYGYYQARGEEEKPVVSEAAMRFLSEILQTAEEYQIDTGIKKRIEAYRSGLPASQAGNAGKTGPAFTKDSKCERTEILRAILTIFPKGMDIDESTNTIFLAGSGTTGGQFRLNESVSVSTIANSYSCAVSGDFLLVGKDDGIVTYDKNDLIPADGFISPTRRELARNAKCTGVAVREIDGRREIFISDIERGVDTVWKYSPPMATPIGSISLKSPRQIKINNKKDKLIIAYDNSVCIVNPDNMKPLYNSGVIGDAVIAAVEYTDGYVYAVVNNGKGNKKSTEIIVLEYSETETINVSYNKGPSPFPLRVQKGEERTLKKLKKIDTIALPEGTESKGIGILNGKLIVIGEAKMSLVIWEISPVKQTAKADSNRDTEDDKENEDEIPYENLQRAVQALFTENEIKALDRMFALGEELRVLEMESRIFDELYARLGREFPGVNMDETITKLFKLSRFPRIKDKDTFGKPKMVYFGEMYTDRRLRIFFPSNTDYSYDLAYDKKTGLRRTISQPSVTRRQERELCYPWSKIKEAFYARFIEDISDGKIICERKDGTKYVYVLGGTKVIGNVLGSAEVNTGMIRKILPSGEIKDSRNIIIPINFKDKVRVIYDGDQPVKIIYYDDEEGEEAEWDLTDEEPDAYFGGMAQKEINPQIQDIFENLPENYRFINRRGAGKLNVSSKHKRLVINAYKKLIRVNKKDNKYNNLTDFAIVVLKGVSFSGHYGRSRNRIYISIELLEAIFNLKSHDLAMSIMEDLIEHEYLHTQINPTTNKYWTHEEIIASSNKKRPGIYEKARVIYRKYIARKLLETITTLTPTLSLKGRGLQIKLNRILMRVQKNRKIELTEVQLHRLLWLIDRSKDVKLTIEIAGLVNLILEPNYTGNPGEVIMAIEKEILEALVDGKETQIKKDIETESQKLFNVHRTHTGDLRFEGAEISDRIRETIRFIDKYPALPPAKAEQTHYVLIDEFRAERFEKLLAEISQQWNVTFIKDISEAKKGTTKDDIVVLVDPEDTDLFKGYSLYLPLVYGEKSFALAAWLSINKPDNLLGTPVFEFVKGFYKELLGEELPETEILSWFKEPWSLKDRIQKLSDSLRLIRFAVEKIDTAA